MIMRTVDCVTKFGSYCPDPDHHQLPPAMMSLALKCPLHNLGLFVILYGSTRPMCSPAQNMQIVSL